MPCKKEFEAYMEKAICTCAACETVSLNMKTNLEKSLSQINYLPQYSARVLRPLPNHNMIQHGRKNNIRKGKNKESKNGLKNCESMFCLYPSCLCEELFMSTSHWTNWLSVFHSNEHDIMAKHCMKLSSSFQQSISQYRLCYRQNEIVFVVNTSKECVLWFDLLILIYER